MLNDKCIELQNVEKEYIEDKVAMEAYATINVMKLVEEGDYLRYISCLNLLNSYVKQDGAKLDYHFKLYLEKFLKIVVKNKFKGIKFNTLKDNKGGYIIIQFGELQFSFHSVKLNVENLDGITDESLDWDGIKKQICALILFFLNAIIISLVHYSSICYYYEGGAKNPLERYYRFEVS